MKLDTIGCSLILSALLTTTVYAKNDKIPCPSVEKIQQVSQQIDDAFLYDGTYRIATSTPAFQESSLSWIVGVKDIMAGSSDKAIEIAKITASTINHKKTDYAEPLAAGVNIYICKYGPGDVGVAGFEVGSKSLKKLGVLNKTR